MEVKNQMMDQLLVNAAQQAPSTQSAKAPKDAERPDFDTMVTKRRATDTRQPGTKDTKAAKQPEKAEKPVTTDDAQDGEPITGEQYAIAAALMMQAQPDGARMAQLSNELVAAENVVTVEAVVNDDAPTPAETTEAPIGQELPVVPGTETEQPAQTQESAAPTQQPGENAPRLRTDRPVEKDRQAAAPEQKAEEPQAQTVRTDAPRAQEAPEQPRFVRAEAAPAEKDETVTEDAQAEIETPVFENAQAAPVKVAEAPRPIPLEAEDGVEQLARGIDGVLVNSADAGRIEVTLAPESLGKLTIEISRGENGALSIVLHPTTERAAHLLERHTGDLQNALTANARGDAQVQVRPAEEAERQFLDPDGQQQQQQRQQQQQQQRRREEQSAQDFLQQLRLGLVDMGDGER